MLVFVICQVRSFSAVGWFAKDADTLRRVGKALLPESVSWEVKLPRNVFYSVDLFEFLSGHPDDTSAMALVRR